MDPDTVMSEVIRNTNGAPHHIGNGAPHHISNGAVSCNGDGHLHNGSDGAGVRGEKRDEPNSRSVLSEVQVRELEEYCSKRWEEPPSSSVSDPAQLYPQTLGFDSGVNVYDTFRLLQPDGAPITPEQRQRALDLADSYFSRTKENYIGYQVNMEQDFAASFSQYLNTHINNVGDAFSEGTYQPHSKFMERAVLDYFASLWRARWPHDADRNSYWGYVLSMGASEGNLYGMWNGRDYLAGRVMLADNIKAERYVRATLENLPSHADSNFRSFTPICFYSKDTHYSLKKSMTVLNIRTFHEEGSLLYPNSCPKLPNRTKESWPHSVPSNPDGSIDIESLVILVEFFAKLGYPILVNFNYGTTFKGAYDDVEAAGERLLPILQKHGMYERNIRFKHRGERTTITRNGFWFHVDGALGAAYMPFVEAAHASKLVDEHTGALLMPKRGPNFDFRLPFVHSISMSGHKWIGTPVPCGIYMSKTKYQLSPPEYPAYIGTPDTTLACSRSGLASMFLWEYLSRHSTPQLVHRAIRSEQMAKFLEKRLKHVQQRLNADLYVFRAALSLSVIFKRPTDQIVQKYTLSTETRRESGCLKAYAHAFAMDHVSFDLITRFCNDLLCHGYPDELATLKRCNARAYVKIMKLYADT